MSLTEMWETVVNYPIIGDTVATTIVIGVAILLMAVPFMKR